MKTEADSLVKYVEEKKKEFQRHATRLRRHYNSIISSLKEKEKATFSVSIHSLWTDHGEEDVEVREEGKLEDVLTHANEEFQRVNKRDDEQRSYIVNIWEGDLGVPVPEEFYLEYIPKQNRASD